MKPDYGYFEETKLGKPYDLKLLKQILSHLNEDFSRFFADVLSVQPGKYNSFIIISLCFS